MQGKYKMAFEFTPIIHILIIYFDALWIREDRTLHGYTEAWSVTVNLSTMKCCASFHLFMSDKQAIQKQGEFHNAQTVFKLACFLWSDTTVWQMRRAPAWPFGSLIFIPALRARYIINAWKFQWFYTGHWHLFIKTIVPMWRPELLVFHISRAQFSTLRGKQSQILPQVAGKSESCPFKHKGIAICFFLMFFLIFPCVRLLYKLHKKVVGKVEKVAHLQTTVILSFKNKAYSWVSNFPEKIINDKKRFFSRKRFNKGLSTCFHHVYVSV